MPPIPRVTAFDNARELPILFYLFQFYKISSFYLQILIITSQRQRFKVITRDSYMPTGEIIRFDFDIIMGKKIE